VIVLKSAGRVDPPSFKIEFRPHTTKDSPLLVPHQYTTPLTLMVPWKQIWD